MAFEAGAKKPEKRKKVKGGDAADLDTFLGPWAKYQDEKDVAKPSEVRRSQPSVYDEINPSVTLEHKTSHKGQFYETEMYTSSES